MIIFGIFIGIYSYILFFLGLAGLLTNSQVKIISILFLGLTVIVSLKNYRLTKSSLFRFSRKTSTYYLFFSLLVIMSLVNLIGALGPELAFDALWYHLTLPKLYLLKHTLVFIPGGLLYYSAMPKLGELIYTGGFSLGSEVYPKLLSWGFGILVTICTYKLARLFIKKDLALLASMVFYSNLVVAWESITAY